MRIAKSAICFVLCLVLVLAMACDEAQTNDAKQAVVGAWKVVKRVERGREKSIKPTVITLRQDGTASVAITGRDEQKDLLWKWLTFGSSEYICLLKADKPDRVKEFFLVGYSGNGRELVLTEARRYLPFEAQDDVLYLERQ